MFNRTVPILQDSIDVVAASDPSRAATNVAATRANSSATSFHVSAALKILVLADFLVVVGSGLIAKVVYLDWFLQTDAGVLLYLAIAVGLSVMLYISYKQLGLYDFEKIGSVSSDLRNVFIGLAISFLISLGVLYAIKQSEEVSRGWVLVWLILSLVFIIPVRAYIVGQLRRGIATGRLQRRTAIIGTTEYVVSLATSIGQTEGLSGAIDLYGLGSEDADARISGRINDLERTMLRRPYDRVIVGIPARDVDSIRAVVKSLGSYTTELLLCSDLASPPVTTAGIRRIGNIRADVVYLLPGSENLWLIKRAVDMTLAAFFLIALLPLFFLVAVAIKLSSRGPVFFCQRRHGQNNTVFKIYKFRSMKVTEDDAVVVQAIENDSRVTRVGRWLRASSIDELPQLINVLLGHMSLVGPRPHALVHDQAFEQQFDLFSRRRRVKPGITGWAQVNGFRGENKTSDDVRLRMEHDLYYIDHWSIWLDIEILARTIFVVAKGAY